MKTSRIVSSWLAFGLGLGACSADHGAEYDTWSYDLTTDYVNIKTGHANKCVDVENASSANGAKIQQWGCAPVTRQQWRFVSLGGNNYRVEARHSGKCLDVSGVSVADGAKVHQWTCHGGANQNWTVTDKGGGQYELKSVNSGKCLDVSGASSADGAQMIQWSCHGGANQRFALATPPGGGSGGAGGSGGTAGSSGSGASSGAGGSAGTGGTGITYYVDPATGAASGDGSAARPWRTIQEVVQAGHLGTRVRAGDTVLLRTGYHGDLAIDGGSYAVPITIAAEAGQTPRLRSVRTSRTSGFVLRGLSISPSHAPTYSTLNMIDIQSSSSKITVENCQLFSVADASAWTVDDWVNRAASGAQVSGTGVILRGNTVRNVRFGISVSGANALLDRNTIENFSADGFRTLGNFGTFQYNVVKNAYADGSVDSNHDDGFQSWSVGPGGVGTGEVVGVVLRGNLVMNYENPSQPFRATLQGIGNFDGTFVDWVIENNVVITDHWHGITLLGARNSRVVNNTVIDRNTTSPGPPWIQIGNHKNGTPPQGCLVRNNLTTDLNLASSGVTQDHNIEVTNLSQFFVNATTFDLHLRAGSPAIDVGSPTLAPTTDRDAVSRPQGAQFDLGAYEFR